MCQTKAVDNSCFVLFVSYLQLKKDWGRYSLLIFLSKSISDYN